MNACPPSARGIGTSVFASDSTGDGRMLFAREYSVAMSMVPTGCPVATWAGITSLYAGKVPSITDEELWRARERCRERLISFALPRVRDFRGVSPKGFDGRGNYTLGIGEQVDFPEIDIDKVEFTQGMDITLRITGNSDEASREALRLLGFPFSQK